MVVAGWAEIDGRGDTDMVALMEAALKEEARRRAEGRADWSIPMRPDHGQDILDRNGAEDLSARIHQLSGELERLRSSHRELSDDNERLKSELYVKTLQTLMDKLRAEINR